MTELEMLNGYIEAVDEIVGPIMQICDERGKEVRALRWVTESLEEAMSNAEHLPKDKHTALIAMIRETLNEAQASLKEQADLYQEACDEYWAAFHANVPSRRGRDDV